jgi:hypothetical protein
MLRTSHAAISWGDGISAGSAGQSMHYCIMPVPGHGFWPGNERAELIIGASRSGRMRVGTRPALSRRRTKLSHQNAVVASQPSTTALSP